MASAGSKSAGETSGPRYEFRIWAASLAEVSERLEKLCGQLDLQQGRIRPRVDQKIERAATVYINRYHDKVSVPGAEPHRELSIRACRGKSEPGH